MSLLKADATLCPADGAPARIVETLPNNARMGKYRIDRLLGEGGMGFVYAVTQVELGRRAAIKMLRPELGMQEQIATRFLKPDWWHSGQPTGSNAIRGGPTPEVSAKRISASFVGRSRRQATHSRRTSRWAAAPLKPAASW